MCVYLLQGKKTNKNVEIILKLGSAVLIVTQVTTLPRPNQLFLHLILMKRFKLRLLKIFSKIEVPNQISTLNSTVYKY